MFFGFLAAPAFAMPGDIDVTVRNRHFDGRQVARISITGIAAEQLYNMFTIFEQYDVNSRSFVKGGRDIVCYKQMINGGGVMPGRPGPARPARPGSGFVPPPVLPNTFLYTCYARVDSVGEVELPQRWGN